MRTRSHRNLYSKAVAGLRLCDGEFLPDQLIQAVINLFGEKELGR